MEHWTDMELINFLELSYNLFHLPYCENEEEKKQVIEERKTVLQELLDRLNKTMV